MSTIPFPSQYKRALVWKTKNSTIRIGNEIGKYEVGECYRAISYHGKSWDIMIEILEIIATTLGRLSDFSIPIRSIEAIRKKEHITLDTPVELIRFGVVYSRIFIQ